MRFGNGSGYLDFGVFSRLGGTRHTSLKSIRFVRRAGQGRKIPARKFYERFSVG
jgi:hypothetical protein